MHLEIIYENSTVRIKYRIEREHVNDGELMYNECITENLAKLRR